MKKYIILLVLGVFSLPVTVGAVNLADYGCHGSGCPVVEDNTTVAENSTHLNCGKYGFICVWHTQPFEHENLTREQYIIKRNAYEASIEDRFQAKPVVKVTETSGKYQFKPFPPFPGLRMCLK